MTTCRRPPAAWRRTAAALGLALLATEEARAETLVTSISSSRVEITSNYTGGTIAVFGAVERDGQTIARTGGYDVVVTVKGPRQNLTVREKEPVGPLWLNREQQRFPVVPAYLGVLSSRPLQEVTTDPLRARFRIGVEAIVNAPDFTIDRGALDEPFRAALIRLKRGEGLFVEQERGVAFLTPTLFRAGVPLPAIAPPGPYEVEVTLFSDTVPIARTQTHFELVKIGFEQRVGEAARDHGLLYGAATAAFALLIGWAASVIFRRD